MKHWTVVQRARVVISGLPPEQFKGALKEGSEVRIETSLDIDGTISHRILPDSKGAKS